MLIIILGACGVLGIAHVHPLVRKTSATILRASGHVVVAYGIAVAQVRYPTAFISDDVRYAAWLESHQPPTLPESNEAPESYGALGV